LSLLNALINFALDFVEGESRDTSAIISSLAQLIMDPYFRTIHGFQSLIQKEWVMLGHPFSLRFGRIADSEAKQVKCSFFSPFS
jgi:Myotubularin-like phosphatase domain